MCQRYCDGIIIAQAYSPAQPSAANQVFVKEYRAQYKKDPPQFAAQAYAGVQVMVEALKALDRKKKLAQWDLGELRAALNKQILAGKYNTPSASCASRRTARSSRRTSTSPRSR